MGILELLLLGSAASCELMELPAKAKVALPMPDWEWRARERLRVRWNSCFFQLFQAEMHWAVSSASPLCGNGRRSSGIELILHHFSFNVILPSGSWWLWNTEMEKLGCRKGRKSHFPPKLKVQQSRRFLPAPSPGAICSQVTLLLSHLSQALFLNQLGLFPSLIPAAKLLFSICVSSQSMASLYHEVLPLYLK